MDLDTNRSIVPGMTVVGSDNGKVGKIVEVTADYVVVEKGFFFPTDYFIPIGAVTSVGDDEVYLSVTKDDALNQGWDQQPVAADVGFADAEGGYVADAVEPEVVAPTSVAATDTDAIRVPVYEEDLVAVTREVDRGAVRIEKELVTEERTITVPVTEERIRVTRVDADDPGAVGADAFEGGVIEVPIRGQEVDVEKSARQVGEVVVEKEAVQRTETVGGTVRREEVRVDDLTVDSDREGDGQSQIR
ncbi:MAG: DUF2382 domain-containing protein [Propionibacteriaceae bacterium]|nr:DUF2382 domain-containing protein [Propionibacteriaceae bacterium]